MPSVAATVRSAMCTGPVAISMSAGSYAKLNGMMNPESASIIASHCVRQTSAPAREDVA